MAPKCGTHRSTGHRLAVLTTAPTWGLFFWTGGLHSRVKQGSKKLLSDLPQDRLMLCTTAGPFVVRLSNAAVQDAQGVKADVKPRDALIFHAARLGRAGFSLRLH